MLVRWNIFKFLTYLKNSLLSLYHLTLFSLLLFMLNMHERLATSRISAVSGTLSETILTERMC